MNINTRLFKICIDGGIGFVWIFGHGVSFKKIAKHPLLFSDQWGYKPNFVFCGWSFKFIHVRYG